VEMRTCQYNDIHRVPYPELLSHERGCPSKYDRVANFSFSYLARSPPSNKNTNGELFKIQQ